MRKRNTINTTGVKYIYEIPNKCTHCKVPINPGDEIIYEPNIRESYCMDCAEYETIGQDIGEWIYHKYSFNPENNKNYCIENMSTFEKFIGEKVKTK